ncbi:flagellar protein [Savagea sp. SN6]|uniref:Flagellar protein n=1 Tax=Savagea serpentis TaxID=2785297 RepID=A0A8J7KDE8_9BACL|nr:TIGR02530 family flagellar biosynthesis protein [Savagea serpentis]MBF4499946.1 flagellar protein [Savagea serpentis]
MDKVHFHRLPAIGPHHPTTRQPQAKSSQSFKQTFHEALTPKLKVSKHAERRLAERAIEVSDAEWMRIESKIDEARTKGVKDSLVLLDNVAMIISAKNRTVITAMNRKEAANQIFTNIDGTILL